MSFVTNLVRRAIAAVAGEEGAATVEYTLVGVCAAGMASILLAWINKTSLIPKFFTTALSGIIRLLG